MGLSTSPVLGKVMKDLSLSVELQNRPQLVDPILQVVTPEMRLDVPRRSDVWRRELQRELPNLQEQLLAFESWAAAETESSDAALGEGSVLPFEGLRAAARYESLVDGVKVLSAEGGGPQPGPIVSIHERPEFRTIIGGPVAHLTQMTHDPASALSLARLWTHLKAGIHPLPEGLDGFKRIFLRKLREQCGDYRPADVVERLVFRRRRVKEVLLEDRGETLGCDLLVANMPPRSLGKLIHPSDRVERYHLDLDARPVSGWRLTINMAMDPKAIPVGMGAEVVLVQDPKSNLSGSNCIWVSRPGFHGGTNRPNRPGPGALCLTVILPAEGNVPTLSAVQRLTSHVKEQLRRLIPWFDDHLLAMDLPCMGFNAKTGESMLHPAHLTPIDREATPGMLGVASHSQATPYKNVILTGESCFSGLGLEGSFLAATQALERTRAMVKIKNTLTP